MRDIVQGARPVRRACSRPSPIVALQLGGHCVSGSVTHIGDARQAAPHHLGVCRAAARDRSRTLMRNISLSRSVLVSTILGVNCACAAMNETFAGIGDVRIGVEHDARLGAEPDLAGVRGRQIDVHVDDRRCRAS